MPCDCNKPKDDGKCGVSPAVMQVNNNNCTLFHRVDVPVAMGDEKVNPPKIGAYNNVLLYYEASGNSYLYSSDGIPTKLTGVVSDYEVLLNKPWINGVELIGHKTLADLGITGAISGAVAAEANARESADNELSSRITANTNAINAEKTARQNADTALGNRITGVANDLAAETTARQNADTTLGNRITTNTNAINTEKTARENADTALSNRITTNTNNIATNTSAIATETTNRQNADNALSTRITSNTTAINNEKTARQNADTALGNRIDGVASDISTEAIARENADDALSGRIDGVAATANSAVQPSDIDRVVMTDLSVDSSSSATQVKIKESKVNLKTGTTSSETTTLPVASSTAAGVMNAATYDAVTNNTNNINAILGGAVAINGLSANPSQSDLTTAWQSETGLSTLINRATIYDVTNSKVWTYYTNDTTWYATTSASTITVNTFTNTSEGVIKGSTADGQVFAENDGTGSVNGWDALTNDVANATTKLAGIQDGAEANVQADWNEADSTADDYIKNKPTIGNATLTIQKNGVNVQTFTANATSNKTANITVPTKTSELTNDSGFIEDDTHAVCGEGSNIYLSGTTLEPIEFHSVGGNTEQETLSGKNLVSTSFHTATIVDYGDNGFILTKPATRTQALDFPTPLPAGTYTFSANVVANTADSTVGIQPRSTGSAYTTFSIQPGQTGGITFTVTATGEMTRIYFYIVNDATDGSSITFDKIQLEAGSTATAFEPYCGGVPSPNPSYPQDVNVVSGRQTVTIVGKNIAAIQSYTTTNHGMTYTFNENGTITLNGTTDATSSANATGTYRIRLEAGQTYTFSANNAGINSDITIRLERGNGKSGVFASGVLNAANKTWTFTGEDVECRMQVRLASGITLNNFTFRPQLEVGNTASEFEQYQTQSYEINLGSIELAKIDTYQDYIWNDGGTWKIHKEVGKVVLDGSETGWAKSYGGTPNFFYRYREIADYAGASNTDIAWMSDKMTFASIGSSTTVFGGTILGAESAYHDVRIRYGTEMATADWQAYLATNPITIYYASTTPTDTEITDAELIGQLNVLWEADGYDSATSIIVDSGGAPAAILSACQYPSHMPVATKYKIGAVVVGHGLDIEPDGRLDVIPATDHTIGGIKVGENLSITEDGVLSADAQQIDVDDTLSTVSENPVQNKVITTALNAKADASTLSTVATTGAYNDLSGKPTIGDATLTIQQNGTDVQTFTANATSNKTANITVPTKTSDLENDSNFISNDTHAVCDEGDTITLDGTTLEPLEFHSVNGNATQETLSGKNKMLVEMTASTSGGLTWTLTDAEINLSGTASSGSSNSSYWTLPTPLEAGTYTFSIPQTIAYKVRLQVREADDTARSICEIPVGSTSATATTTYTITSMRLVFVGWTAGDSVNITLPNKLQLESGSSATDFEPYCGGVPSPNPSYPQDVNVVSGGQTVKITGKNLAEMQNDDAVSSGITASRSSTTGEVTLSGTSTATATINASTLYTIPIVAGEAYTISANNAVANSSVSIRLNIQNVGSYQNFYLNNVNQTKTFTSDYTGNCTLQVGVSSGKTLDNYSVRPQVEHSATASAFEPYQSQSQEINLGKNLLKTYQTPSTVAFAGVSATLNSDGTILLNGTGNANGWLEFVYDFRSGTVAQTTASVILDNLKTYTLSSVILSGAVSGTPVVTIQTTSAGMGQPANLGASTSFTGADGIYRGYIRIYPGDVFNEAKIGVQLEAGTRATSFVPYKTPLELAKIGTYQDYIWNDGGTWKIHKEVGKVVLDGSEGWGLVASSPSVFYTDNTFQDYATSNNIPLSDHFMGANNVSGNATARNLADNTMAFIGSTTPYRLYIRVTKFNSVSSDFKTWLNSNPTTVYYALATPTDTEITDATLIGQLNTLWETDGYDGATNLFVTATSGAPAQLDLCQYPSHLPIASKYKIGAVVVGHGLDIEPDGRLDVIPASADTIGGIKVGNNLTIDENGVLSADAVSITIDNQMSNSSTNPVQNKVITAALAAKPDSSSLSAVATSGSYNDLLNKPTIPTVNNATLTIQKNGTTVKTFTANASSNVTANITVPTKTSELSNNSGFLTSESDPVFSASPAASITTQDIDSWTAKSNFSGSYNDLTDKPTIPTVNNATLTIQKNGTNVQTFTANSSTNKTANLEIPVITLTDIDPGEGGSLAANNFIGVYI